MQTQGKGNNIGGGGEEEGQGLCSGEAGGVLRMWDGDSTTANSTALQSDRCPCYRFGKNMKRAGFGSSFVQGSFHLVLVLCDLANTVAFAVTQRYYFLYLAVSFTLSVGAYMGFFRMQMQKKFNTKRSDSYLDDCFYHLICPCYTLSQEARTIEMNDAQDETWHGCGDTICI